MTKSQEFNQKVHESMVRVIEGAALRNHRKVREIPRKGNKIGSVTIKLAGV